DKGEMEHLRGVEEERIGPPPSQRLVQLGKRAREHARRLEEPPRPRVAFDQEREQLAGRVVVPAQRLVAPETDPVEQPSAGPRMTADGARGVERDVEREP